MWSLLWKKSDSLHADTCNWLKSVLLLHSQLFSNQMWIRRHCIKNNNKDICSSWFYHHLSLEAALLRISNEILMRKDEHFWFNSIIQILTLILAENFGFSSVILSCRVSQGSVLGPAVFALYLLAFGETWAFLKVSHILHMTWYPVIRFISSQNVAKIIISYHYHYKFLFVLLTALLPLWSTILAIIGSIKSQKCTYYTGPGS